MSGPQDIAGGSARVEADKVSWAPQSASPSLEELATRQGIAPVTNLDELSGLWPADDDPDRFMSFVISERQARRDRAEQA